MEVSTQLSPESLTAVEILESISAIRLICEICGSNIHHSALTLSFHANGDEKK